MSCCGYNFLWLAFPSRLSLNHPSTPCICAHPCVPFSWPPWFACVAREAENTCVFVLWLSTSLVRYKLFLVLHCSLCYWKSICQRRAGINAHIHACTQLPMNPCVLVLSPHGPVTTLGLKLCCCPDKEGHSISGFQGSTVLPVVGNNVLGTSSLVPGTADRGSTIRSCKCHQAGI